MQSDFNSVVQWIFAQLNAVLDFISHYYILRIALFVPIAGALIVAVYYMLQVFDVGKSSLLKFGKSKPFSISSMSFGSVQKLSSERWARSSVNYLRSPVYKKKKREAERKKQKKREERLNKKLENKGLPTEVKNLIGTKLYYNQINRSNHQFDIEVED